MIELTHVSLFAGIGGIDLAAEWAGFKTILFVEIDPYCQKVLNKHWPDVPIIGDIQDVTREKVMAHTQHFRCLGQSTKGQRGNDAESPCSKTEPCSDGNRGTTSEEISPVTLVTGGFPCQPVSQAGQRKGKEDDRWLWPDMLRVISEVRPTWVVAENVTGLLTMGFYDCLSDLEGAGYKTIPFVIPACGVNAPHRRDRIFIVAHYEGSRLGSKLSKFTDKLLPKDRPSQELESSSGYVANTEEFHPGYGNDGNVKILRSAKDGWQTRGGLPSEEWWAVEPELGRVAYGIPNRVDRLKCLGNAVVPQQIYPILKAIADIERLRRD